MVVAAVVHEGVAFLVLDGVAVVVVLDGVVAPSTQL